MGSIGGAIEVVVARPLDRFKRLDHLKREAPHGRSLNQDDGGCIGSQTLRQAHARTLPPSPAQTGYHTSNAKASSPGHR
jgi:hypothetical protein